MEEMKAEVTAFRPIFRLLCCRRGLRKNFRGLRPRILTPKKLSRAVKNLPEWSPYFGEQSPHKVQVKKKLKFWNSTIISPYTGE